MKTVKKRVLVSFDDLCPYQCKHCYTLGIPRTNSNRSIETIVKSIAELEFDIVYVSQRRENFINQNQGIELCEQLFEKYKCHILIITRNVFETQHIERLKKLKNKMATVHKNIVVAVSVFATKSYSISENPNVLPTPNERLQFVQTLAVEGFDTITMIRPVFPSKFVPVEELYEIVDLCETFDTCIVSSGLAVNENILWQLHIQERELSYVDNAQYLEGAMEGELRFVDVSQELDSLKKYCKNKKIPFFEHSMSAVNFLLNSKNKS